MKKIKLLLAFTFFLCLSFFYSPTYSQQYLETAYNNHYDEMSFSEIENAIAHIQKHFKSIGRAKAITSVEDIIVVSEKFNKQRDYYLRARCYNLLGKIYFSSSDYEKALKNHKIAELFIDELDNTTELAVAVNNDIAQIYIDGYNKPGKALKRIKYFYENSEDLDENTKHILTLRLATIYIRTKNYRRAFKLLEKCKKYFTNHPEQIANLVITYTRYGEYHVNNRNYQAAITNYEQAASIAEKNKLFRQAMTIYSQYEKLLVQIGRQDLAYEILKRYTKHHQTALDIEKAEADQYKQQLVVSEEKTTIETQKAEQSKTISIFTLSLLFLCLTLFCFFIYHHKKTKMLGESLALKNRELKKAKEKSDRLAAVKTKFTSTVSHELRTPLYGVIGLSSILMQRIKDEENHKFIKLMKFSADHLLNLINDVLQVTKMESYEISLDKSDFNIKNLAYDIKNSFEYQAEKNGNTLHLNFDPNIPSVLIGDSVRLSQILINLISNANKFTINGDIWLNFKDPVVNEGRVDITFEIKDNGRGIPLDKQEDIFEKFSQANSSDHATGTGLGLNIVQKLVHLHGGEIKLKSTPGEGSVFYFAIAFNISESPEAEHITNELNNYSSLTSSEEYHVLIVEDNKINQIVTQNILKSKGYTSEIAEDGLIALELAEKNNYDLILMDLNMPNMGGMEATKKIREFDLNTPIIALTASDTPDTIKEILDEDSGFNDYLKKPFKNEEFFQKLSSNINTTISKAS